MGAMICDFGKKDDGYNLYRINGTKEQVINAIKEIENLGCEVLQPYELEPLHGFNFYTTLIKIFIPDIERYERGEKINNEG